MAENASSGARHPRFITGRSYLGGLVSASYSNEEIKLTHSMRKQLYTLGLPSVSGQEQDHQALLVPEIGLHLARQAAGLLLRYF